MTVCRWHRTGRAGLAALSTNSCACTTCQKSAPPCAFSNVSPLIVCPFAPPPVLTFREFLPVRERPGIAVDPYAAVLPVVVVHLGGTCEQACVHVHHKARAQACVHAHHKARASVLACASQGTRKRACMCISLSVRAREQLPRSLLALHISSTLPLHRTSGALTPKRAPSVL